MALQSATIFLRLFLLLDEPVAPMCPPTMAESPEWAAPAPAAPNPCTAPCTPVEELLLGTTAPAGVGERERLGEPVEDEECECEWLLLSTCMASPRASKSKKAVAVLISRDSSTCAIIMRY